MSALEKVLSRLDADLDGALARLFDLLRIPSISTDPAYAAECERAAQWLVADLRSIGFDAEIRPTGGRPMVLAKSPDAGGKRALFYGHYDVQPVDPLSLWRSEPFSPQIETRADGSKLIRARGSSDDKGQLMTFVEACRAWKAETGSLPIGLTILFEGEEESGSTSMEAFLEGAKDDLRADFAMVCDTGMWDAQTPSICASLRGLVGEEVILRAASRDLHSGSYGGAARNPIAALCDLLSQLRAPDGSVTLPGFYDGVPEIPAAQKAQWDGLGFDEAAFLGAVGLTTPAGEQSRSVMEQIWARPTCEINGITGGYTGEGFKTVIPAEARAKVSFRLVGDQDPVAIRSAFRAFIRDRLPADCTVEFHEHGGSPAVRLDVEGPEVSAAAAALSDEWGKAALTVGMGGSIPIVGEFKSRLGLDSVMVGFALADDAIHSPNEKYDLESFRKGARSWARILAALAQ